MSARPSALSEDDIAHYRAVLREMVDLGVSFARLLHEEAQATAQSPATPITPGPNFGSDETPGTQLPGTTATLAVAFDRVSRAVRRGIALARALDKAPHANNQAASLAARRRIIRDVEDAITREAAGTEAEALHAELCERLDAPEFADDLNGRPIDEIINEIRHDLGLDGIPGLQYWKRRTPADIATIHARAAATPGAASSPGLVTSFPPAPGLGAIDETLVHHLAQSKPRPRKQ